VLLRAGSDHPEHPADEPGDHRGQAGTWIPTAPQTTIGGKPALVAGSTCVCSFGGVITITMPGALRTTAG